MSTGTPTCDIVIPGYRLTDRIGSGGYAEVWRAEAPGGIQKAVKVVYGYYDDEFASQELKALERIKGVRHPFLLSLERFEVVNGRLAILTELADMSLDERLRQCRAEGLPGIAREELLRYMSDAAEALDFLFLRHSLLHLDIKPENLLVLGDHIKVADFGLVKELASRTQNSLVSGMTPTYASPEMFDDEPSAQSDQYSLAIVYQQMLVGTLPFPGRTSAQLAKQHLLAEPQLMSLPPADRPVIARALAKKPAERFPTCREFVEALRRRELAPSAGPPTEIPFSNPRTPRPLAPAPDDTKPPSFCTTIRRPPEPNSDPVTARMTQPLNRHAKNCDAIQPNAGAPAPAVPEETVDIPVPEIQASLSGEQPTLYVAMGGTGIQALCRLRDLLARRDTAQNAKQASAAIALDTDRDELREACQGHSAAALTSDDVLHLPLRLPKSYDDDREILNWVSRRWLYNIPRSLETRGYRPLGRVALVDHSQRVRQLIDNRLERLAGPTKSVDGAEEIGDLVVKVVLLSGTGGGTGGGMAIDVANAVRSIAAERDLNVEVHGYFICNCFAHNASSPLLAANTYSLLTELNHSTALGNEGPGERVARTQLFESTKRPFDFVYWLPDRARTEEAITTGACDMLVKYLALDSAAAGGAALRACRLARTPREESQGDLLAIRKLGYASLADEKRRSLHALAEELAAAIKLHWLTIDSSDNWERRVCDAERATAVPKLEPVDNDDAGAPPVVVPVNDATPLALRGRFKEFMSLEFASEVVRQIQLQFESRDDRGRPLLLPNDAKIIADTARQVVATLAKQAQQLPPVGQRFLESPILHKLVVAGSGRVLHTAIEKFDYKQPDRHLRADAIEEPLLAECLSILDESLAAPESAKAVLSLIELDKMAVQMLDRADTDLLQCGCERRNLVLVPKEVTPDDAAVETMRSLAPLAAFVPAEVDDVVVVSEDAGVSPRSVALGLERVFPGIADAARRLFTRVDVEWKNVL